MSVRPFRRLPAALLVAALATPAAAATFSVGRGGSYPDLNAAVAAAVADPAVIRQGRQMQDIVFAVTAGGITSAATQRVAGWQAGGFSTTIQPAAGQGFREFLRAHPQQPVRYDPAYGAFIADSDPGACLRIEVARVTIFGMQIACAGGHGQDGVAFTASPAVLDSSILVWDGVAHDHPGVMISATNGLLRVRDALVVGTDPNDSLAIIVGNGSRAEVIDSLLAMRGPAQVNMGAGIFSGVQTVLNTAAFNFGRCSGGKGGADNAYDFDPDDVEHSAASNDFTCFPAFRHRVPFAHRGQMGAAFAREIVGTDDWRLAPTAMQMRGTGLAAAGGVTLDMLGRPRNIPDDIGPLAFAGGSVAPDLRRAKQFVIRPGTTAWRVPAACTGPANAIEAIGAGGPGGTGRADGPGRGGGGGEYVLRTGFPFTAASPGTLIAVQIAGVSPPGRQPVDTVFGEPAFVRATSGQAGGTGHDAPGGLGGRGGLGTVLRDGGDAGATHGAWGGSGGGGAGGRNGDGGNSGDLGTDGSPAAIGSGGGGNDGGGSSRKTEGRIWQGTAGGAGTNGRDGAPGGAHGAIAGGEPGARGGGGGGGSSENGGSLPAGAGGAGGAGTEFGGIGPGGGGGGGGGVTAHQSPAGAGGDGGAYGAGGGGAGQPPPQQGTVPGGRGAPGLIVVRCVPAG